MAIDAIMALFITCIRKGRGQGQGELPLTSEVGRCKLPTGQHLLIVEQLCTFYEPTVHLLCTYHVLTMYSPTGRRAACQQVRQA